MLSSSNPLASAAISLDTTGPASRLLFTRDIQPIVLQACRLHKISLDEYAMRLGTNRTALVLMLKGIDPVPLRIRDALRDFVATARESLTSSAA